MRKKMRLLFFMDGYGDGGGIQEMVIRWIQNIDRDRFHIDVLSYNHTSLNPGRYRERLADLGCNLFLVDSPERNLEAGQQVEEPCDPDHAGILSSARQTMRFFREHPYDVLHCNSSAKGAIVLACAKAAGVKVRILHSHCAKVVTKNPIKRVAAEVLKVPAVRCATHLAACSTEAGEFLFGKGAVREGRVTIFPNAIELDRYAYDPGVREDVRLELGATHLTKVYADVARFQPPKNQQLLIRAFAKLLSREPESLLVLVGDGDERAACESLAVELGCESNVRFLGLRGDVARLDQGFDVFAMTSLFEGLPVVAVEAQAAGLPCVLSGGITAEACVLPASKMMPADASADRWAEELLATAPSPNRADGVQLMAEAGFEIHAATEKLQRFYFAALGLGE